MAKQVVRACLLLDLDPVETAHKETLDGIRTMRAEWYSSVCLRRGACPEGGGDDGVRLVMSLSNGTLAPP